MLVPESGKPWRMQSSHRNFLAASIGAVVLLGSADAGLAQTVALSSPEFSHSSTLEDDDIVDFHEGDRPAALGVESLQLQSSVAGYSVEGSVEGSSHYRVEPTLQIPVSAVVLPVDRSIEGESLPELDASDPATLTSELSAAVDQAKSTLAGHSATQQSSVDSGFGASREEFTFAQTPSSTVEPSRQIEPTLNFRDPESEAELRSQTESADSLDSLDSETSETVELEADEPDANAGETDTEAESSVEDNGSLEQVPILEDEPTSDSAVDLEVAPEAVMPLSAPDYLESNPNPLYFPTEPGEVEIEGTQPITLAQALEIARRNSRELRNAQLSYEQAEAALDEARSQRFPEVTAGANLTHTDLNRAQDTTTQINPVTGEEEEFDLDTDDNTTTFDANVQITYDLFTSGQRRATIRAAERNLRQQELQVEVVLEDIRLNVTNAYYDVQETDESVRIARSTLEESLESLRIAEARERAGVGTRFDRLQAEVDAANSQQDLRSALSNQSIARRQLAQVLSIPSGIDISAADEVEVAGNWLLSLEESLVLAFKNRAEPEQLLVQREIDEQQRRAELAALGPQLSAFGRYRTQDLLDETRGSSDNEAFEVGLQLSLLLFDGGAARARARQESIGVEIAESDFADTLEEIRFDVEEAYFQLQSNFENIQTAATAVEVAEESLRLARLRFSAGVGIQSDVITAQADLTEAEFNLVTAILDYNRALVSMQRAVSNLDDNNLSDVP